MPLVLYAHPFASYCWKALIALYESQTPFDYRVLNNPPALAELAALWPLKKFPVLKDGDAVFIESTIIVEHLALSRPGPTRLIPEDAAAATKVRFLDRVFDNYVHTPLQKIVSDFLRVVHERDAKGVAEALADCAAAPALFYADWVHPIGEQFAGVRSYRQRLLARPSVARTVDEARPYRKYFPPGAPDRD